MQTNIIKTKNRDLALDALRGVFIVILTIDHMSGFFSKITWQTFGYVTVLPGFVFVSGYIVARAYGGAMRKYGTLAGLRRIVGRIGQIYVWHVVAVIAVIGGTILLSPFLSDIDDNLGRVETLIKVGLLYNLNYYFNIIPLYIFFLALAAVFLVTLRRYPFIIAMLGILIWLLADVIPKGLHPWADTAMLTPLRWQVLFTLGLAIGLMRMDGKMVTLPRWLYAGAAAVALVLFALRWHLVDPGIAPFESELFGRNALQPGRLLNILCLILLISSLLPHLRTWLQRSNTLIMVGQNSLIAFSLQIIIMHYLGMARRALEIPYQVSLSEITSPDFDWFALVNGASIDVLAVVLVITSTYLVVGSRQTVRGQPSRQPLSTGDAAAGSGSDKG